MESTQKVRIKDIAEKAGVSVGTVDRVLHGRTNVSKISMEKVQKVLNEINYVPNHYASALASNKQYVFAAILPLHEKDSYWEFVEHGLRDGMKRYSYFKISLDIFYYDPFNDDTFKSESQKLIASEPSVAIVAPIMNCNIVTSLANRLKEKNIPYAFLDSNLPELDPVTFYGQNSIKSGEFSARIMLMAAGGHPKKMSIFKIMGEGRVASRQQYDREIGFKNYMKEHCPECIIDEVQLYAYDKDGFNTILREYFKENPDVPCGVAFNSSIHKIAEFLSSERESKNHMQLLGYDATAANIECIKNGSVDFLVAQHPFKQGLNCFRSLFNSYILHTKQQKEHYVAIELLTKENIDFYMD